MSQPAQVSPLLPIVDVAGRLNCSVSHVYRLVDSGALPALRIGPRALRVDEADLGEYLLRANGDDAA
jgi:excisionase family DNA binding protein